jgi:hypothetical protein
VEGDSTLDRVAAQGLAGGGWEQRLERSAVALGEPHAQHVDRGRHQGRSAFLAALADAVDVGADAEGHVRAGEAGHLRDPQAGLDREQQQRVVTSSGPSVAVTGGEQRIGFLFGEEGHQVAFDPFGRDGQHALDRCGVLGVAQRGVGEQRVDRCQPVVASSGAVAPVALEMV